MKVKTTKESGNQNNMDVGGRISALHMGPFYMRRVAFVSTGTLLHRGAIRITSAFLWFAIRIATQRPSVTWKLSRLMRARSIGHGVYKFYPSPLSTVSYSDWVSPL